MLVRESAPQITPPSNSTAMRVVWIERKRGSFSRTVLQIAELLSESYLECILEHHSISYLHRWTPAGSASRHQLAPSRPGTAF